MEFGDSPYRLGDAKSPVIPERLQKEEKVAVPGTAMQIPLFEELPHKTTV